MNSETTLADAWPYLLGAVTFISTVVALIARRDTNRDELRRAVEGAQPKAACLVCRREVEASLTALKDEVHNRAHKSEVIAHAALLAEHGKSLAVLEAHLQALNDSMHRIERLVEQLVERT